MGRSLSALVLLGCLVSAGCGGSSPSSPTPGGGTVDVSLTLAPGQRAPVDGTNLTLTFTGVSNDSRCPADAICVQFYAADATAVFEASLAASTGTRLELGTSEARRGALVGDYRVELRGLDPYPFSSQGPINPADYRATLHVTR
jgi:hypothetical protein